jgi:hypothetical protein
MHPRTLLALPALCAVFAHADPSAVRFLNAVDFVDTASGQQYAYLRFQAQNPADLLGIRASVHAKAGTPGSAAPFQRVGAFFPLRQPSAIEVLANSFPAEIFDRAAFTEVVEDLFGEFSTGASLDLGDLLSTVLQVADGDPGLHARMVMLAYAEPFLAACMGIGQVIPMSDPVMTFEIRSAVDGAITSGLPADRVIGRVTLDAAAPVPLPQPPAPQHIPDPEVTGHLNVKLRWDLNPALLRATPRVFGFDVFRIEKSLAEANSFDAAPPTAAQMAALLDVEPAAARRLNQGAVLPVESPDPDQPYFVDDNDAAFGMGLAHEDGDAFYYFIAARDLLGRHGPLSQGTLITVCARFPAESPRRLRVAGDRQYDAVGGSVDTRLLLSWRAHASAADNPPAAFQVYRWDSVSAMHTTRDPLELDAARVSALIPFVPGQRDYSWRDDGPGAPTLPDAAGRTFWYSVRTVVDTACGPVESGDSSPAWGVLRDFRGPDNAPTVINLTDSRPAFTYQDLGILNLSPELDAGFSGPSGNVRYISLAVARNDPAIESFRFGVGIPGASSPYTYQTLGQTDFAGANGLVYFNRRYPSEFFNPDNGVRMWIEARDFTGRVKRAHTPMSNLVVDNSVIRVVGIGVFLQSSNGFLTPGDTLPEGFTHRPVDPASGEIVPLGIAVEVPEDAREYKAYKRIDSGPLVFFAQGTEIGAPGSVEEIEDTTFPPFGGEVCYFIQWFDTHGNPSPLAALGCVPVAPKNPLPVPLLEPAQAAGEAGAETVVLRWFCPPDGIDRFRVYVGEGLSPAASIEARRIVGIASPSADGRWTTIGTLTLPGSGGSAPLPGIQIEDTQYFPVDTLPLSAGFGNPFAPGQFELELPVTPGLNHRFFVVAVAAEGSESAPSNIEDFLWELAPTTPPVEVPWPARAVGGLDRNFLPSVSARVIDELPRFQGIGILIGNYFGSSANMDFGGAFRSDNVLFTTPTSFPDASSEGIQLFTTPAGESILPCVVYRQQVDPDTGEPVSGDLIQVSPMIEDLLLRTDNGAVRIHNPFVDLYSYGLATGVFIKDTQPVIRGNTYQYHVVRFKPNGEIDRVLPLASVTVTVKP